MTFKLADYFGRFCTSRFLYGRFCTSRFCNRLKNLDDFYVPRYFSACILLEDGSQSI